MVTLQDLWDRASAQKRQLAWRIFDQDGRKLCDNYTGPGSGEYDHFEAADIRDVREYGHHYVKVIIKNSDMRRYITQINFLINCRAGDDESAANEQPWARFQISGNGSEGESQKLYDLLAQHGYKIEKFETSEQRVPIIER